MTQSPFPSTTPESLDLAFDAFAAGDSTPLDLVEPGTAATWSLLQEWTLHGGLDTLEVQATTPETLAPNHSSAWSHRPPTRRTSLMTHPATTLPAASPSATSPRRLTGTVFNVIAWLVIVVLAGGAIWGVIPHLRDGEPSNSPQLSVFADATPETSAEALGNVNYGGDPGQSWWLSNETPDIESAVMFVPSVIDQPSWAGVPLIVGDSVITNVLTDSSPGVARYDLQSNEMLWIEDHPFAGTFASDGTLVFGLLMLDVPTPAALNIETGTVAWTGPPLKSASNNVSAHPIIVDQLVYFADPLGNLVALNKDDGSLAWQYPESFMPALSTDDLQTPFPIRPDADLVAAKGGVFLERPSKTIAKLDPLTGEELDSINVIDTIGYDVEFVTLQASDDRLVITASRTSKSNTDVYRPSAILVLDIVSFDPIARSSVPDLMSNLVVTQDAMFAVGREFPQSQPGFLRFEYTLDAEPIRFGIFEVSRTDGWFFLSLAGDILMMVGSEGDSRFLDLTDPGSRLPALEPLPSSGNNPWLIWRDMPILVLAPA